MIFDTGGELPTAAQHKRESPSLLPSANNQFVKGIKIRDGVSLAQARDVIRR